MDNDDGTERRQRYLMVGWRLSDKAWQSQCDDVLVWLDSNPETLSEEQAESMRRRIATPISSTEHPLVVIHCYDDVPTGTLWDTVFDPKDPDQNCRTTAISRFSIVCDRTVEFTLVGGWHQTVIIDFPDGCPDLIRSLPVDIQRADMGYVGLCKQEDFPEIYRGLKEIA